MYKAIITILLYTISITLLAQTKADVIQKAGEAGISAGQVNQAITKAKQDPGTYQQAIEKAGEMGVSQSTVDNILNEGEQSRDNNTAESGESTDVDRELGEDDIELNTRDGQRERRAVSGSGIYGREIFSSRNLTFAPSYNIPTPKNYILSASDEIVVNIWGASKEDHRLTITPEGTVTISNLGPVFLSGLTIEQAEEVVRSKFAQIIGGIEDEYPTTFVAVTLGKIRSIKVNMLGEVANPGTYTLPSLGTLFNAMYVAGGVNNIGSLRDIQLFRSGRKIASLDVYDFLLKGKYDTNVRLEDGDMVIVGPYKSLVSIGGKVKRNRTFELTVNETMSDLMGYAGGFTGNAFEDYVKVNRSTSPTLELLNVNKADYAGFVMNDGDVVSVSGVIDAYTNRVTIGGTVWRGGEFELTNETNTVTKLIAKAGGLQAYTYYGRAQILRYLEDGTTKIISFNLKDVIEGKTPDIEILDLDNVYIYSIFQLRDGYRVTINGEVRSGGTFGYNENMSLKDLIQIAGGLTEAASTANVEISRRIKNPGDTTYSPLKSKLFTFAISESLDLEPDGEKFMLEPYDMIIIRRSPNYSAQQTISVTGEALFRGSYVMAEKGMRLSDLVKKAGGITPEAYVIGARLERRINEEERKKLQSMARFNSNEKDSILSREIALRTTYTVGIDLEKALANPGTFEDVRLREGDNLFIPEYVSTVSINGAVRYPNVVTYSDKLKMKDYISEAGGYLQRAKKKSTYVVYMNGKVSYGRRSVIMPGSEIIIPMKLDKKRNGGAGLITGLSLLNSTVSTAGVVSSLLK